VSTLTKVLIVLLSVASIFLCGIVATYVATADNFKAKFTYADSKLSRAGKDVKAMEAEVNRIKSSTEQAKASLQAEIGRLKNDLVTAKSDLTEARIKGDQLQNSVDQLTSQVEAQGVTNAGWQDMLKKAEAELVRVNADLTTLEGRNKETATAILEKMAIITQLEGQVSQLAKEKEELQAKFVQFLRKYGKTTAERPPDNMRPSPPSIEQFNQFPAPKPTPIRPLVKELGLKGVITQLDLKNSYAEISIGAADGVKEKMRFYATRGDAFICEILILEVFAERAVGLLERVQSTPKSGDGVSTNIGL